MGFVQLEVFTRTSLIGDVGKGLTVVWYFMISQRVRFLILVTVCFLISGFFGSSDLKFTEWELLPAKVFLMCEQIIISNLIYAAFNLNW